MWPSRWDIVPQSKKSLVSFLVRAHAWVAGSVPGWGAYERQPIDVSLLHLCFSPSLSLSLPLSLKINRYNLKKRNYFIEKKKSYISMKQFVLST